MADRVVMVIDQPLALVRLLHLVSPALPVGAFSYSQGLERAVEDRVVHDEKSAKDWIGGVFDQALSRLDAPVLARFVDAWSERDIDRTEYWNHYLLACRETRELRDEDSQLGRALARLLDGLGFPETHRNIAQKVSFAMLFGFAAAEWQIPKAQAVSGYLWAWLENQVLAAIKLLPLGQLAGQRMLFELAQRIPASVERALAMRDDQIGGALPFLAIASSRHETQYTRLFRS
ncbi:MAG: urease accessory protein UreF [Methylococcales bacterium]